MSSKVKESREMEQVAIHVPTLMHLGNVIAENMTSLKEKVEKNIKVADLNPEKKLKIEGQLGILKGYDNILGYINSILTDIEKQREKKEN